MLSAGLVGLMALLPSPSTLTASWYGPGFHGRPTASGAERLRCPVRVNAKA